MSINTAFQDLYKQLLPIYEKEEANGIAALVIEHYTGVGRTQLKWKGNEAVLPQREQQLAEATSALLLHKPVQYVLGEAWFYNMPFYVNESVLIPRPETEELVQWVLQHARHTTSSLNILEIGTGSGCMAIALKKALASAIVTAIDISDAALDVAKQNAIVLEADVQFLQLDFLNEVQWKRLPVYDIIVSNPPYIPLTEKAKLALHVTEWEPSTALFVPDNDALIFYKKIALFAKSHLNKNGHAYVECHQNFAQATEAMFKECGYKTQLRKDIFDNERMLKASID